MGLWAATDQLITFDLVMYIRRLPGADFCTIEMILYVHPTSLINLSKLLPMKKYSNFFGDMCNIQQLPLKTTYTTNLLLRKERTKVLAIYLKGL